MTLVLKFDLNIVITYFHTNNKVSRSIGSKVISKKQKFLVFYCHDLDLGPMTLTLKLDLDIIMTYICTKNEGNRSIGSKVIMWTHRQKHTQRQTDMCKTFTFPLSRTVKISVVHRYLHTAHIPIVTIFLIFIFHTFWI